MEAYLQLATSAATFLTALAGTIGAILALRQGQKNAVKLTENKQALDEHINATNGRLDQLLVTTAESSKLQGHAEGVEDERSRAEHQ